MGNFLLQASPIWSSGLHWALLAVLIIGFLYVDMDLFARGGEPDTRLAVFWSIGWLVISMLAAVIIWAVSGAAEAVNYTTVYFIERSLSLDNLVVFILLFSYFSIPVANRAKLLFWGIVLALVLRAAAILGGIALLEKFHLIIYVLGVLLLLLAYRMYKGVNEEVHPDKNLLVRAARKLYPVTTEEEGAHLSVKKDGKRYITPLFLCLLSIVAADIAFAIDSIPAAFAITRDSYVIWMGNAFALLGLRALFVLVEKLLEKFRYMNQTVSIVLGLVAVKLLIEDVVHIGPILSLGMVLLTFLIGIGLSLMQREHPNEHSV